MRGVKVRKVLTKLDRRKERSRLLAASRKATLGVDAPDVFDSPIGFGLSPYDWLGIDADGNPT